MPRRLALVVALCLLAVAPAQALVKIPANPAAIPGNPADALAALAIEDSHYDAATRCSKKRQAGMDRLVAWLGRNAKGQSWGTYRCEKWGKGSASLHAEGRALDWHLDAARPADRREAKRLILLLLAPDKAGNAQALARRMGVEEIIWDCGYWSAGMNGFKAYSPCYSKRGKLRKKVGKTIAHRDHLHIGMTKDGAAARTSFWTRKKPGRPGTGNRPGGRGDGGGQSGDVPAGDEHADDGEEPSTADPGAEWGGGSMSPDGASGEGGAGDPFGGGGEQGGSFGPR